MKTDPNTKYLITKPTILYCIKDFHALHYTYDKNNTYTVTICEDPDHNNPNFSSSDDIYFIINNGTYSLVLAKTSLYNTGNLEKYFINILEERKQKLDKINQTR